MTTRFTIKRDDRGYKIHLSPNQIKRFGVRIGDRVRLVVEKIGSKGGKRR